MRDAARPNFVVSPYLLFEQLHRLLLAVGGDLLSVEGLARLDVLRLRVVEAHRRALTHVLLLGLHTGADRHALMVSDQLASLLRSFLRWPRKDRWQHAPVVGGALIHRALCADERASPHSFLRILGRRSHDSALVIALDPTSRLGSLLPKWQMHLLAMLL